MLKKILQPAFFGISLAVVAPVYTGAHRGMSGELRPEITLGPG